MLIFRASAEGAFTNTTSIKYEIAETDLIFPVNTTYDPSVKLPLTWVMPTADVALLTNPQLYFFISRFSNEPTTLPNDISYTKYDFNLGHFLALTNTTSIREGNKIYFFAYVEGMDHEGEYFISWRPFMEDCDRHVPKYADPAAQQHESRVYFSVKAGGSIANLVDASRNCSVANVQFNVSRQAPSNSCVRYSEDHPTAYQPSTSCAEAISNTTAANITRLAHCHWNATAPGCIEQKSAGNASMAPWASLVFISSLASLLVI